MADYCCDCKNLDRGKPYKDFWGETKYHCKEKGCDKKLTDESCRYFKSNRKDDGYKPSGCYITTIVCDILSTTQDIEIIEAIPQVKILIHNFCEEQLQNNEDAIPLLMIYDEVGPNMRDVISSLENKSEYATFLFKNYLLPCALSIKDENYKDALQKYIFMLWQITNDFGFAPLNMDPYKEYNLKNKRVLCRKIVKNEN